MATSGARGLVMLAGNPDCEMLGAMVAREVRETDFYQVVAGRMPPREFGERPAGLLRGMKFEERLYADTAAGLRACLAPQLGRRPDSLWVRDLSAEVPGRGGGGLRARRLSATRSILRDLAAGKPVPDIIIQPQLVLPVGPGWVRYITPDFLILWPGPPGPTYLPGEIKGSIVVQGHGADPADLRRARLQAGVELLALRAEYGRVGLRSEPDNRAFLVFSSPFGLQPYPSVLEALGAEVYAVQLAINAMLAATERTAGLRGMGTEQLGNLSRDLRTNLEDGCRNLCLMWDFCRERGRGTARELGDGVGELLGPEAGLDRAAALLTGASPETEAEVELAERLSTAIEILGYAGSGMDAGVMSDG